MTERFSIERWQREWLELFDKMAAPSAAAHRPGTSRQREYGNAVDKQ